MIDYILKTLTGIFGSGEFIGIVALGLPLLILTIIFELYNLKLRNKLRRFYNGRISRFIKSYGFKLLSIMWVVFSIFGISNIINSKDLERVAISSFLFIIILILNYTKNLLFKLVSSLLETLVKIYSFVVPRKTYQKKVKTFLSLPLKQLLLILIILFSFSFGYFISRQNYVLIGVILVGFTAFYILKSLIDIFLMQRDLLLITDKLEIVDKAVTSLKNKKVLKIFRILTPFVIGFMHKNIIPKNELEQKILLIRQRVEKARFFSRYGLSFFKLALTLKLFSTLFATIAFVIITETNYHYALDKIGIIKADGFTFTHYLLNSFYIFIGENVSDVVYLEKSSFFSLNTLFVAGIGWFLTVAFIIMFIDIITISVDEFSKTIKRLVDGLLPEFLAFIDFVNKSVGIDFDKETLKQAVKTAKGDSISNAEIDTLANSIEELENKIQKHKTGNETNSNKE